MYHPQFLLDLNEEVIVDNFAGGGGASTGIERALRRHVDHAINHDRFALGMHRINHPQTIHHCEDIFDLDPEVICGGRPCGLCHNSPDCKHFSKAKGGKPLSKKIRGLVLVMLKWAKYGARVLTMENVEEIVSWGPLKRMFKQGKWGMYPDPDHKGRTWMAFLSILSTGIDPSHPDLDEIVEVLGGYVTRAECVRGFGYQYEARVIRACDHGSPTIRKRLFMVARRDDKPIIFPEQSHFSPKDGGGKRGVSAWRTIAECIDWERPCPSIFLTGDDARKARCKRPLAKSTLRRIAQGIDRFVLRADEPYLVSLTHQGGDRVESVHEPARTITGANRGEKALVVSRFNGNHAGRTDGATRNQPVTDPLTVQDTSNRFGLVAANLMTNTTGHPGAAATDSMPTLTTGNQHALITGAIVNTANSKTTGRGPNAWTPEEPARTITSAGGMAAVAGTLVQTGYGEANGQAPRALDPKKPLGTVVAGGGKHAVVTGSLIHTAHGEVDASGKKRGRGARDVRESMPSVLSSSDTALAAASMVKMRGTNIGSGVTEPVHTVSAAGKHHGVVAASVFRHFGESVGQTVEAPAPTTTAGGGGKTGLIAAHLTKFTTGSVGQEAGEPITTITAGSHSPDTHGGAAAPHGVVAAYLAQHNGGWNETPGHAATEPVSAISSKGCQQQVVAASLAAYYGNEADGQAINEPTRTVTTKERFGFVESTAVNPPMTADQIESALRVTAFLREYGVQIEGDFATVAGFVIVDIGMRMLTPRELFRAQGFPEGYVINRAWLIDPHTGQLVEIELTKEQQIRMCGNSVCPDVMEALVKANVPELAAVNREKRRRNLTLVS